MTAPEVPGLQPERTSLAWRRTALSVAIGSIVALRVLPAAFEHAAWYVPGVVGVAFAAWMWWASYRRYAALVDQPAAVDEPRAGGAGALFVLALFTIAVGVVAVSAVLIRGVW